MVRPEVRVADMEDLRKVLTLQSTGKRSKEQMQLIMVLKEPVTAVMGAILPAIVMIAQVQRAYRVTAMRCP
jgi:hypothetical protein